MKDSRTRVAFREVLLPKFLLGELRVFKTGAVL